MNLISNFKIANRSIVVFKEAFDSGPEQLKIFQSSMEDDIERGEKLKQELIKDGWGGNE